MAHAGNQCEVVTGNQHAGPQSVDVFKHAHDFRCQTWIEVNGRLIGQQQGRAMDDSAGNADTLLLAGGQVAGVQIGLVGQRHTLKCRIDALGNLRLGQAEDLQGQGDVVEDRAVEQQLVILEHYADLPTQKRDLRVTDLPQVLTCQHQFAGRRALHGQQQAQQRALAGTGMTGDEQKLAAAYSKAQFMQPDMSIRVALTDLLESNHGRSRSANRA
ncbi:hypothetical protein ALP29_200284 [Pseudomonas syringae pv. avii]|uniref:Uncharacterized protein n=1 Tax=Pseudomonas syringae pv. avii TaxID=663959 RepID=A0A3M5VZH8_PSESX|nr:hypothetical protein ALP29_200284 [Pseudomonas syringae pv. avii]